MRRRHPTRPTQGHAAGAESYHARRARRIPMRIHGRGSSRARAHGTADRAAGAAALLTPAPPRPFSGDRLYPRALSCPLSSRLLADIPCPGATGRCPLANLSRTLFWRRSPFARAAPAALRAFRDAAAPGRACPACEYKRGRGAGRRGAGARTSRARPPGLRGAARGSRARGARGRRRLDRAPDAAGDHPRRPARGGPLGAAHALDVHEGAHRCLSEADEAGACPARRRDRGGRRRRPGQEPRGAEQGEEGQGAPRRAGHGPRGEARRGGDQEGGREEAAEDPGRAVGAEGDARRAERAAAAGGAGGLLVQPLQRLRRQEPTDALHARRLRAHAIRPNVLGKFRDLLGATAQHRRCLYLDNSAAPPSGARSPAARRSRRTRRGA